MNLQEIRSAVRQSEIKTGDFPISAPAQDGEHHYAGQLGTGRYPRYSLIPSEIRAMQRQRGEEPCFSTDKRYTCSEECELRKECLKLRAVWLR